VLLSVGLEYSARVSRSRNPGGGKGPVRTPAPIGYYYEPGPDGCALLLPIVFSDAKRGAFCLPGGSYIRIETFGYCYYSSD
jgi:hypothetical protein